MRAARNGRRAVLLVRQELIGLGSVGRRQVALSITPVRRPGQRHQLHGDVGLLGLDAQRLERLGGRVARTLQFGGLGLELGVHRRDLLIDRLDRLLGASYVLLFTHRAAGAPRGGRRPANRRATDQLPATQGTQQRRTHRNRRLQRSVLDLIGLFLLCCHGAALAVLQRLELRAVLCLQLVEFRVARLATSLRQAGAEVTLALGRL